MGAGSSAINLNHLSAEDVGKYVAQIGPNYQRYQASIVDNGLSGAILTKINEDKLKSILMMNCGITNEAHLTVMLLNLQTLKENFTLSSPAKSTSKKSSIDTNHQQPLPDSFVIVSKLKRTPRFILSKIFKLPGIPVDPSDLEPAIDRITRVVKAGYGNGKTTYDCYLSYRRGCDDKLVERVHSQLAARGIYAFLDRKSLASTNELSWKQKLMEGVKSSKYFVILLSNNALAPASDPFLDHTNDKLLIECVNALKIAKITKNSKYICPLHIGECTSDGVLTKFQPNASIYPDCITALSASTPSSSTKKPSTSSPSPSRKHKKPKTPLTCRTCGYELYFHRAGTWGTGWACDGSEHEGLSCMTNQDPVYGCPTVKACNWGVCQPCWTQYQGEEGDGEEQLDEEQEAEEEEIEDDGEDAIIEINLSYDLVAQYDHITFVLLKSITIQASPTQESLVMMTFYQHIYGTPPSLPNALLRVGAEILFKVKNVHMLTSTITTAAEEEEEEEEVAGEDRRILPKCVCTITFEVDIQWMTRLSTEDIVLQYASGYNELRIPIPHSTRYTLQEMELAIERPVPICGTGKHYMFLSDHSLGEYAKGYTCDLCRTSYPVHAYRWYCDACSSDLCLTCEPIRAWYLPTCPHVSHEAAGAAGAGSAMMSMSSSSRSGRMRQCIGHLSGKDRQSQTQQSQLQQYRRCDGCHRRQLEEEICYFHCPEHVYDLCLSCTTLQLQQEQYLLSQHHNNNNKPSASSSSSAASLSTALSSSQLQLLSDELLFPK